MDTEMYKNVENDRSENPVPPRFRIIREYNGITRFLRAD